MFEVRILGTGASVPTPRHMPSAQLVSYNHRYFLVDCGESTQIQLLHYRVRTSRLDAIFISHMHGDHVLGLPGLLASLSLFGRNFPLKIYAPSDLKAWLDTTFTLLQSHLVYPLEFYPLEDFELGSVLYETERLKVEVIPLEHRIFCRGFRFVEHNKRPKFDFYRAKALDIPNQFFSLLKQGNTVTLPNGREVLPEEVLLPPDPALAYAYCSDTAFHEPLIPFLEDTQLLYHESTFTSDQADRAAQTAHSTAAQAAQIAKRAGVKQLVLGHFSARYRDERVLLDEAREIFPATELAREGKVFELKHFLP